MSNRPRIDRTTFQDNVVFGTVGTLIFCAIVTVGIFYDNDAFIVLIPFGFIGLVFGSWYTAGWIYDRRYRR